MTALDHPQRAREVRARFTADEFMELARHEPIAGWTGKVELVDGEIVRMAPANIPHWVVQRSIVLQLQSIFADLGTDWVVGHEPTVRLAPRIVRIPDVAVLHRPDLAAEGIFPREALFLAVEVADSSLKIDLGRKRRDYARAAVPHYWVADLGARRVLLVSDPANGAYRIEREVGFGQPLPVPGTHATITVE